jgi:hypothetical protein
MQKKIYSFFADIETYGVERWLGELALLQTLQDPKQIGQRSA